LVVNFPVVLFEVHPLYFKDVMFKQFQLVELAFVNLFALQSPLIHSHHFEIHNEVLEIADDLLRVDVSSIYNSHLLTLQRIGFLDVLRGRYS
jgi:hypothetical protein